MTDRVDPMDARIEAALGRLTPEDLAPAPPPEGLWEQIAREVGDDPPPATEQPIPRPVAASPAAPGRTRRPWSLALAASVATLVALGSAVWFVSGQAEQPQSVVLAQAQVSSAGLGASGEFSGTASLVDQGGARVLELTTDLPSAGKGEVFEVWLFDDAGDLQSLGLTDGASQHLIPEGVDLDQFTVVDVSREEFGGDPAHSKDSIVRGALV